MITNDYLLRQLQQLAKALARIAAHREQGEIAEARDLLTDTVDDLLGHQPHMLEMLDPANAARMLSQWPKIKIYAALLDADAELHAHDGDDQRAERTHRRALAVYLEGLRHGGKGDPELRETVTRRAQRVHLDRLSPAHQRLVQELRE